MHCTHLRCHHGGINVAVAATRPLSGKSVTGVQRKASSWRLAVQFMASAYGLSAHGVANKSEMAFWRCRYAWQLQRDKTSVWWHKHISKTWLSGTRIIVRLNGGALDEKSAAWREK